MSIKNCIFEERYTIMTADQRIKKQIIEKIDHIPSERLSDVLEFLAKIEEEEQHIKEILAFAGTWQDLDQEVVDDLTVNLHANRILSNRAIDTE
jgi:phosphopantetheine adenylyltransferase